MMLGVSKLGGGVLKVGEIQLGPDESRWLGEKGWKLGSAKVVFEWVCEERTQVQPFGRINFYLSKNWVCAYEYL